MKIVYLIHSLNRPGGMERVLTVKANYLADVFGYEVVIVTARQNGRKPAFELSPKVQIIDLGKSERFFLGPYKRVLAELLERLRPDVTVSLGGRDMLCLSRLGDGSKKMSEFHFSHDKYYLKHGYNIFTRMRTRKMERAAAALDAFVVLTKRDCESWKPVVPRVAYIYNPLPFTSERSSSLPGGRCMAVGRLMPQKNFEDLISAWAMIAPSHPDWKLDIFGEGKLRDSLTRRIESLGLTGKVTLCGRSSDVRSEMLERSCLAMSSRFEGFPMVLLEAAECGLPMVAYDCPCGPSEIVEDGVNGVLVPYMDVAALAAGIQKVLSEEDARKSYGAAARSTATRFRIDDIMGQWKALFEKLVTRQ